MYLHNCDNQRRGAYIYARQKYLYVGTKPKHAEGACTQGEQMGGTLQQNHGTVQVIIANEVLTLSMMRNTES